MFKEKRSFFERITGSISVNDEEDVVTVPETKDNGNFAVNAKTNDWPEEEPEGELSVDVYQTDSEIILQSMIAGVKPENLTISITREMITLQGKRERPSDAANDDYFLRELYWGSFSRKVLLPAEVEPTECEAFEKNGLLTIRMPKIDKEKTQKIKVRSL
ncbi:MAG TPA: Hsp20/alpha crystallin family protein [Candidatus Paceibacterota bacterium]|nr:Hsp20/alpha crystallin family protein [Candidatus Paceibacterota bacterium]